MKTNTLLILFIASAVQLQAQISQGIVLDANTYEPVVGASVFINGTTVGTSSDEKGIFDLRGFPKPPYQIHISAIGYETGIFEIPKTSKYDTVMILLESKMSELAGSTIKASNMLDNRCNTYIPGWGSSLGTVSFVTERVFPITNGTITQFWSDAVRATNCQKKSYDGGGRHYRNGYNADCRSNPHRSSVSWPYGDLFSWCAVYRFRDQLCPDGWRVPTKEDFANLDIILGGLGYYNIFTYDKTVRDNYVNRWHGAYGGICTSNGNLSAQRNFGGYWSLSERDAAIAYYLGVYAHTLSFPPYNPEAPSVKSTGRSLRCVR